MSSLEILDTYIELCRIIGPWQEWVQGAGGNISVKEGNTLIVKASGTRIADASPTHGWVKCDLAKVKHALETNNEDVGSSVIEGTGKPSIETFLHAFDSRIIVHLHPSHLMDVLCSAAPYEDCMWEYYKPGLPLAKALAGVIDSGKKIYLFKNHGVLLLGNTVEEIIDHMITLCTTLRKLPAMDIQTTFDLYKSFKKFSGGKSFLLKPTFLAVHLPDVFKQYTPDIAVFLQDAPLIYRKESDFEDYLKKYGRLPSVVAHESVAYTCAQTLPQCYDIQEILLSYNPYVECVLTPAQVSELVNWDKEKERRAMHQ